MDYNVRVCHRLSIITCDVTFTHSCYFLFPGMCMYISSCELCSVVAILPLLFGRIYEAEGTSQACLANP